MSELIVVVILLAIVMVGGELLFTWAGDRFAPKRDAAIWRHVVFYIVLIGILGVAVAIAMK